MVDSTMLASMFLLGLGVGRTHLQMPYSLDRRIKKFGHRRRRLVDRS
jgi:hypothetical protein